MLTRIRIRRETARRNGIGAERRTSRLGVSRRYVRCHGSSGNAKLKVDVIYLEVSKKPSKRAGVLAADEEWAPSPKLGLGLGLGRKNIGDTDRDGVGTVAYRFTAVGGDFSVDDVYTDPRMRR